MRIGTRGSALALAQARLVVGSLPGPAEIVPITTSGDRDRGGDKARFVKEIEEALLAGEVDLAVHSAKDVPAELPDGLAIVGVPERADPRDALCGAASLDELPEGALVGTSSLRRRAQLLAMRPDLDVQDLRGNVDTRLRKLAEADYDALVLAAAGLERLDRGDDGSPIAPELLTPAAGQGALALEARVGDRAVADAAEAISHRDAFTCLTAERALVAELEATCRTPVGAHAWLSDGRLSVAAFVGLPDGSEWVRDTLDGDPGEPGPFGVEVAERVLAAGGAQILSTVSS
ncbi:MAG TPA: hydroxymethylbilane synthase [Thermoleophilaceae bacterium]|nr:hydroxymethylbilane synthase [Thermoleophilaceae bacterium]